MTYPITAAYAAVLTLIFVLLSQLVIRARSKSGISLGGETDDRLLEASRRHLNFIENVPLTLILLLLAEAGGASFLTLNVAGAALVLARVIHPFGITVRNAAHPLRLAGHGVTTAVQLGLVALLAIQHFT